MPSAASIALKAGLTCRHAVTGETLIFRAKEVVCSINRAVVDEDHPGRPNFSTRSGAAVQVRKELLRDAPRVGEVFASCRESFRIRKVEDAGLSYLCRCDVS